MAQAAVAAIPRAGKNEEKPPPAGRPRRRGSLVRISSNLALLSAAIGLVSLWILYYTDWSVVVGGLAGVTGVFALLSRALTETRRKHLQRAFEVRFLARPIATRIALSLVLLLAIAHTLTGTVVVRSLRDDASRSLAISRPKGLVRMAVNDVLLGRSARKFRLWQGFGGGHGVRVKLAGLPAATVRLHATGRTTLDSPDDFLRRPVVLVRPTPTLGRLAPNARLWLVVVRGKDERDRVPFTGKAVWIGCDADVLVPTDLKSRWQLDLAAQNLPFSSFEGWLPPTAQRAEWNLKPGDRLQISIQTEQGTMYGQPAQLTIPRVDRSADFPLEVVLDVPHRQ